VRETDYAMATRNRHDRALVDMRRGISDSEWNIDNSTEVGVLEATWGDHGSAPSGITGGSEEPLDAVCG
jgi:hypothetical protein